MAALAEFEGLGIGGRQIPEKFVDKHKGKKALVVASGECVWDDLRSIGIDHIREDGDFGWIVIAVNDMIMHFPGRVLHGYSNQHRLLASWCGARRETMGGYVVRQKWESGGITTHSCGVGGHVTWPWPGHGTSTLNAVYTALAMGCDPVVICGAPLDNKPHYFEPPWVRCNFEREVGQNTRGDMLYWDRANKHIFKSRVFAQSGRTKELLGAFTG